MRSHIKRRTRIRKHSPVKSLLLSQGGRHPAPHICFSVGGHRYICSRSLVTLSSSEETHRREVVSLWCDTPPSASVLIFTHLSLKTQTHTQAHSRDHTSAVSTWPSYGPAGTLIWTWALSVQGNYQTITLYRRTDACARTEILFCKFANKNWSLCAFNHMRWRYKISFLSEHHKHD